MKETTTAPFNQFAMRRFIKTVCDNAKLEVQFVDRDPDTGGPPTPKATANKIILPKPHSGMTEDEITLMKQYVLHETLHHTEGPELLNNHLVGNPLKINNERVKLLVNLVEDSRIERKGAKKYRGDAQVFEKASEILYSSIAENLPTHPLLSGEEFRKVIACVLSDGLARAEWSTGVDPLLRELLSHPHLEAVRKDVASLVKAGFVDRINKCETVADSVACAKALAKHLWPDDDPEEKQQQGGQQGGASGGKERAAAQDMMSSKHALGNEGGDGKGRGKGEGDKKDDGELGDYTSKPSQADLMDDTKPTKRFDKKRKYHYEPDSQDFVGLPTILITYRRDLPPRTSYHIDQTRLTNFSPEASAFGNRLRYLLQVRSAAHYVGGHKRGNLDRKRLFRVGMPAIDGGEWNNRVFKKREQSDTLDSTVTVLVDFSGSMGGGKLTCAINAMRTLVHAVDKVLGIPIEVLGFTDNMVPHEVDGAASVVHFGTTGESTCHNIVGVLKARDDVRLPDDVLVTRANYFARFMGNNDDGEAIQVAHDRLMRAPQKRKILIVLSDGSPAASGSGDCYRFTKSVIQGIEASNTCEIVGIGIEDAEVKGLYTDNQVIHRADQIEDAVLSLIRRKLM